MIDPLAIIRRHARPLDPVPTGAEPRLRPLPGIRAVLFDIYGTLFLSAAGGAGAGDEAAEAAALAAAAGEAGLALRGEPAAALAAYHRLVREHQDRRRTEGVAWPEVEIRAVWGDWLETMRGEGRLGGGAAGPEAAARLCLHFESLAHPVWPFPGALETIGRLAARGLALGLVSNAQFYTPPLFPALLGGTPEALGFAPDLTVYSYLVREAKPSIRLFADVGRSLAGRGLPPEAALYVGNDLRNDIQPAAAAGFRTAWFAGDARSWRRREGDPLVAGVEPDLLVTSLDQIPGCLVGTGGGQETPCPPAPAW